MIKYQCLEQNLKSYRVLKIYFHHSETTPGVVRGHIWKSFVDMLNFLVLFITVVKVKYIYIHLTQKSKTIGWGLLVELTLNNTHQKFQCLNLYLRALLACLTQPPTNTPKIFWNVHLKPKFFMRIEYQKITT